MFLAYEPPTFDNLVCGKIDRWDIVLTWILQGNHQVYLCIKGGF